MAKKHKFLVEEWVHYSRLGRRRKKLLKYRKARGRDNKVRLKMKGHLRNVDIGFKGEKSKRGLIKGKIPVVIYNINDLKNLKEKQIGVVGKVGNKRRMEIADYSTKNKIELFNLDAKKFLEKIEETRKKAAEEKAKLQEKIRVKEKKEEKKQEKTEETESQKTKTDSEPEIINKNETKNNVEDKK